MDKPWKVILAFAGIFLAGTVTGLLVAPRIFQKMVERRWQQQGGGPRPNAGTFGQQGAGPQFGPQLLRRIGEQLELTPEQREKIKPIELRTTEDLRRLRRETQHSTELVIERMHDEIGATLTPAQRAKFEELVAKARERMEKFMQEEQQRVRIRREGQTGTPGAPGRPRDGSLREGSKRDGAAPK